MIEMFTWVIVAMYLHNIESLGLTTAELGIIVTVILFATAHLIMLMKWGSNIDKSTGVLANRIDSLAAGLEKVENALAAIADVNIRFNYLEKSVKDNSSRSVEGHLDHEARIRAVEKSSRARGESS